MVDDSKDIARKGHIMSLCIRYTLSTSKVHEEFLMLNHMTAVDAKSLSAIPCSCTIIAQRYMTDGASVMGDHGTEFKHRSEGVTRQPRTFTVMLTV